MNKRQRKKQANKIQDGWIRTCVFLTTTPYSAKKNPLFCGGNWDKTPSNYIPGTYYLNGRSSVLDHWGVVSMMQPTVLIPPSERMPKE